MKSIVGTIDRVAFSFGPFTLYWYGLIIVGAMLLAITLASKEGKKRGLGEEDITDMAMWAVPPWTYRNKNLLRSFSMGVLYQETA